MLIGVLSDIFPRVITFQILFTMQLAYSKKIPDNSSQPKGNNSLPKNRKPALLFVQLKE